MGSWNATCLLTRLPIRRGDPVVALVLEQQEPDYTAQLSPFGPHDPMALWRPVGFPLRGDYNDYGWIENVVEDGGTLSLSAWLARDPTMADGEAWSFKLDNLDDKLTKLNKALIKFLDAPTPASERLRRRSLLNHRPGDAQVGVAMIHAQVYDRLLLAQADGDLGASYAAQGVDAFFAYADALRAEEAQLGDNSDSRERWRLGMRRNQDFIDEPQFAEAVQVTQLFALGSDRMDRALRAQLFDLPPGETRDALRLGLIELILLNHALLFARLCLMPNGMGGQDRDTGMQRIVAEETLALIAARGAEDREDEDWEDEGA